MWEILALLIGVGVVAHLLEKKEEEELDEEKVEPKVPESVVPLDIATLIEIEMILGYIKRYEKKEVYCSKRYKIRTDHELEKLVKKIPNFVFTDKNKDKIQRVFNFYENEKGLDNLKERNKAFINKRKESDLCKRILINSKGQKLNENQIKAVLTHEFNTLAIASAGSGKSTTLVSKLNYLNKEKFKKPRNVLTLVFNSNARKDLINKAKGFKLNTENIHTFHSFGKKVIKDSGRTTDVSPLSEYQSQLTKFISKEIKHMMKNPKLKKDIIKFFEMELKTYDYEDESVLHNKREKEKFKIETYYNDEIVRSKEECEIANFLFINQIKYMYEKSYTKDNTYGRPDFYLKEYDIWIEHWGFKSKKEDVPHWFEDHDQYKKNADKKRKLHEKYKTTLVESFSYEFREGNHLDVLKQKLENKGVKFKPISDDKLYNLWKKKEKPNKFAYLVSDFLNHFKSNNFKIENLEANESDGYRKTRENVFIHLFENIYKAYKKKLEDNGHIDFHDMLNEASKIISDGKKEYNFTDVLVDEFQDTSHSRKNLIRALQKRNDKLKLFCVGDDWQSIYRFTGSDIDIMLKFKKHFETRDGYEKIYLNETYRFSDELAKLTSKFISQNKLQLKKKVFSSKIKNLYPLSFFYGDDDENTCRSILNEIKEKFSKASILFLDRYKKRYEDTNYEPPYLKDLKKEFNNFKIRFSTIHSVKGQEEDFVILLGAIQDYKYPFPSDIKDDPLLNLVMPNPEEFKDGEERRLLYVALTRCKYHAYIVRNNDFKESYFISDLKKIRIKKDDGSEIPIREKEIPLPTEEPSKI